MAATDNTTTADCRQRDHPVQNRKKGHRLRPRLPCETVTGICAMSCSLNAVTLSTAQRQDECDSRKKSIQSLATGDGHHGKTTHVIGMAQLAAISIWIFKGSLHPKADVATSTSVGACSRIGPTSWRNSAALFFVSTSAAAKQSLLHAQ